jgi:hypothetical protein
MLANIYLIENNKNSYKYIGQTGSTLEDRMKHHKSNVKTGKTDLYKAMREIGFENFSIKLIEFLDEPQHVVDNAELYWINYYSKKYPLYNMKYSEGKCGGDTLTGHPNFNEICSVISEKTSGGKNSQATKVMAIELSTGKEIVYDSFSECQKDLNIPRHDIIGRRCKGKITKPYNGYMFKYY